VREFCEIRTHLGARHRSG